MARRIIGTDRSPIHQQVFGAVGQELEKQRQIRQGTLENAASTGATWERGRRCLH